MAPYRPDDASPAYPSLRGAAYVIGVLFAVTLMAQLDRQLPALLVRPLRDAFRLSDTSFSLLQGYAFALSLTLAGLPFGRFVDRSNRRNLIAAGLVFWTTATALFAFGQSYSALLLARVGVGIGEAVLAPAACSLIADLVAPHRRGRALGIYGVSVSIGSGASLLLGGWLLAAIPQHGLTLGPFGTLAPWRVAFLAAALPGWPLALLLLATVREPARQPDAARAGSPVDGPAAADFTRYVRRHPATFARLWAYPALLAFLGYGALSWAPALFERSHGIPPSRSGMVLGIGVALAGTAGMLAGGFISDRWQARGVHAARLRVALWGLGVAAGPAVAWPLMPNAAAACGLLLVMVFGISLAQSAVPASIQAAFPNRLRGRAVAACLLLSGLLGIGLGPTAVALITDRVFHDDGALKYALALAAAPVALFGVWLVGSGLSPYARTCTSLAPPAGGTPAAIVDPHDPP